MEDGGTTSRAASRGSNKGELNDNEDEDNLGSDNDAEQNDNDENEGEEGVDESSPDKRGRSKTGKKGRKSKGTLRSTSPHANASNAASSGTGSVSPSKRARRPSMDNIGKFPASTAAPKSGSSLTALAAAKKTATAVKSKSKTTKKRRGSFSGSEKPDAGEESEHDEEVEADGELLFLTLHKILRCLLNFVAVNLGVFTSIILDVSSSFIQH